MAQAKWKMLQKHLWYIMGGCVIFIAVRFVVFGTCVNRNTELITGLEIYVFDAKWICQVQIIMC